MKKAGMDPAPLSCRTIPIRTPSATSGSANCKWIPGGRRSFLAAFLTIYDLLLVSNAGSRFLLRRSWFGGYEPDGCRQTRDHGKTQNYFSAVIRCVVPADTGFL